jgi:hypothetical protein
MSAWKGKESAGGEPNIESLAPLREIRSGPPGNKRTDDQPVKKTDT